MRDSWKKVSIQKIAEIANVGTATVDRALNNRTGVKKSTKMKILNALHYLEKDLGKKKKIFSLLVKLELKINNLLKNNDTISLAYEIASKRNYRGQSSSAVNNSTKVDSKYLIENTKILSILNNLKQLTKN